MNVAATLQLTAPDIETGGVSFMACHRWLEEAHAFTSDPDICKLIVDVTDDLWAIGSVEGELGELVLDALESVATAIEVQSYLASVS